MSEEKVTADTTTTSDEATTTEAASCTASDPTVPTKNTLSRNASDTTDAAKTVDISTPDNEENYTKKPSIESNASTSTPVHVLALGEEPQQPPSSPTSNTSPNSTAMDEVERLRREAEQIKAEQEKLQEEIRLAKQKKEELTKEVHLMENEDHIDIYCDKPIDVMSAITEDHRTLMLRNDVEVMSQITEARTEARHFSNLQRRKKWMIGIGVMLLCVCVVGVVGGIMSRNNGGVRGGGDGGNASNSSGETSEVVGAGNDEPTASPVGESAVGVGGSKPTPSPTKPEPSSPTVTVIDVTDDATTDSSPPSPSISTGSTTSPTFNATYATKVKIQLNDEDLLNIYEVRVLDPSGNNLVINKTAEQSSTWDDHIASHAIDGVDESFSSTLLEEGAWWQVDLGEMVPIQSVVIVNYWCINESEPDMDPCLSRLSDSSLQLLDEDGNIVAMRDIGDTSGKLELSFEFHAAETVNDETESVAPSSSGVTAAPSLTIASSAPPIGLTTASPIEAPTNLPSTSPIETPTNLPSTSPIETPTNLPSASPIQTPTQEPTSSPTKFSCASDEAIFSVFMIFGADPSEISWYVTEQCSEDLVAVCNKCYQDAKPYSSADSHNCLPKGGYTFYFEDPAGGVWPTDPLSGYAISYEGEGNAQTVAGNGGSMPSASLKFGEDVTCPTGSPTAKPSPGPTTFDQLPFPYAYPYDRFITWDNLNSDLLVNAQYLGYTSDLWDEPNSYILEYGYIYDALNSTQQQAINNIGMNQQQWDCFMNHYENYHWILLPDHARDALTALGWVECSWERDPACSLPATESSNWRQLNATQRAAAIQLCWFRSSWDGYTLPW